MIQKMADNYALLTEVIDFHDTPAYLNGDVTDFNTDDTEIILEQDAEPTDGLSSPLRRSDSQC